MADQCIGLGDIVEFPVGSEQRLMVVDLNITDCCTPCPNLMLASRRAGHKVEEGIVQTQHVRLLQRAK